MSRAVLVGGSGLIGTAMCHALKHVGHEVTVLDLQPPQPEVAAFVRYRRCDIRQRVDLDDFPSCERVYLLAALLGRRCTLEPSNGWATNVMGTTQVLDAITRLHKPPTVCFFSSAAVYRSNAAAGPISEDAPTHPNGLYGASKLLGEALLRAAGQSHGLRSYVVRPFTAYGPGPSSGLTGHFVAGWIERHLAGEPLVIHGDGNQTVDLVHVTDVARLCCLADEAGIASTEVPCLNVGSGIETPILTVAEWFGQVDSTIRVRHVGEIRPTQQRNFADIALARRVARFNPTIAPRDGIMALLRTRLARLP
jgi:UDP-glucose 4-epimerase